MIIMECLCTFGITLLQNKNISVYLLLVVLFHLLIGAYAIEPGCENCGCCVDNVCSPKDVQGHSVKEYCTRGCLRGIGGNKCYNKCAKDCTTCNQTFYKNCATCVDGKYINKCNRCVDCPHRCKNCTSVNQCQECNSPYYNDGLIQDCSLLCPRNCYCGNIGVCSSCKDGFYNASNSCRNECPDTCKTCSDQSQCKSCKPSYSGDMCCTKNGHCLKCSSSTVCEECLDGFYGEQCGRACPTKCGSSLCNKENGNCFSCQDGYYGAKCDKSCPKQCHQSLCEKDSGVCLSCNVGLYGNNCTEKCSKTCFNTRCHKQTGNCSDGYLCGFTESSQTKVCTEIEDTGRHGIGAVIGITATILVGIVTIVVIVTIFIVRRWKMDIMRKKQGTPNVAGYVNIQPKMSSIETVDASVKKDEIDHSKFERLDRRNDKKRHKYENVTPVNK